ncbi:LysR family transcriptional regulator [[Mycobacterium] holstebronense]|uniref:LysR substrate-binding domain-containing protein n=1 Tax=[Mycobacterium] holstebronense TaxID=3064288 RepID=A0ABM9LN07_9MYCO|nr:LysR substrate-binding domain-containing protein [Mycolicibacter sp. MU0102]CAJ1501715.1 LysR substrate-binding domain-containing protein [Mycolicibacter sp. MU0102]
MRHFVVAAEELHFSRAAARVYLAQQALSRQIKDLEDELGVKLFERNTRNVILTPAGEVFLEGARGVLAALDGAAAAAEQAARGVVGTLRLGYVPGAALELTAPIIAEFQESHPEVTIEMREFQVSDPSAGLASRATDVAFLRLPQNTANINTEILAIDPVVAMVSTSHRHAGRTSVSVRDLLDDPITQSSSVDQAHHAFWSLAAARTEATKVDVVRADSITEEAQVVAAGAAIAVTSAAAAHFMPLAGVRFLPIEDWPGSAIAVGWTDDEPSPLVSRFVDVARLVRDREPGIVHGIEHRLLAASP